MRLKLVSGDYFLELKNAKNKQKNYSISFLNSFYVPILKSEGNKKFKKDLYYKYAICNYDDDINQNNFDNKNGFVFQCHISVYKQKIFKGQIQIKPFFDIVYITKNDTDGKIINDFIIVKFNIITSNNMNNPIQYEEKNMKSGYSKTNNKQDFLLLDSNLSIYICPDIPILTIKNYNEGIQLGGINPSGSKIILLLLGFLTNGYEYQKGVLKNLDKTKDEIQFNLEVIDNLEDKEKIKSIKCTIPSGSSINKNIIIEVRCIYERTYINNNIDLTLNWALEKNNYFDDIVIIWPNDIAKKKNIFFYEVEALSVKKKILVVLKINSFSIYMSMT